MGKPITKRNTYPYTKDGIKVQAAVLKDGTQLTDLYIVAQRSVNVFDLSDGNKTYEYLNITTKDKDGNLLKSSDTNETLSKILAPQTFCVKSFDETGSSTGFIGKFLKNKIIGTSGVIYNPDYDIEEPVPDEPETKPEEPEVEPIPDEPGGEE